MRETKFRHRRGRDTYLVTGAAGFTGAALVRALVSKGVNVRAADVRQPRELPEGAEWVTCDVSKQSDVEAAVAGVDCVMHTAAVVPFNLPKVVSDAVLQAVNVDGTKKLVEAAEAAGARRFIFASSTGVVFGGDRHISGEDETCPIPQVHNDSYSRSKALAEAAVVGAASRSFGTVSLRPNGIWGPGEGHHIPKLLKVAVAGMSGVGFGVSGDTDFPHVDNLVAAFLAADASLADPQRRDRVNGKAYFVTDGRAFTTIEFFTPLLKGLGFPAPYWMQWLTPEARVASPDVVDDPAAWPHLTLATSQPTFRVPDPIMAVVAWGMESVSGLLGVEPFLSSADLRKLTRDNYYVSQAARDDLGWAPVRSVEENILALVRHYRDVGYDGRVPCPPMSVCGPIIIGLLLTFALAWDWAGIATALAGLLLQGAQEGWQPAQIAVWAWEATAFRASLGPLLFDFNISRLLQGVSWGALAAHGIDACIAGWLAASNKRNTTGWVVQTALLGFPSLQLLFESLHGHPWRPAPAESAPSFAWVGAASVTLFLVAGAVATLAVCSAGVTP